MVLRLIFLAFSLLLLIDVNAQQFQVTRYRVEDGLPSDVVKGVIQDTLRYYWVATDDGLARYDGINFSTYRSAVRSPYTKGFLRTKSGRLLMYGDLDLLEIRNLVDTVEFKTIRQGGRNPGDSTLWYPKAIFEDRHQALWLGEPQSIVRLEGSNLQRYNFSLEERSPQFLRSFSFFEDARGDLYTVSIRGIVFKFNETTHSFTQMAQVFPSSVEHLSIVDGKLMIGSGDGFFVADLLPTGGYSKPELILKASQVSTVTPWKNQLFIGTRGQRHYLIDRNSYKVSSVLDNIDNTNQSFVSDQEDLWIAAADGLFIVRENLFQTVSGESTGFVESITEDDRGHIFFANMVSLYAVDLQKSSTQLLLNLPSGYFQSLQFAHGGLWAANGYSLLFIDGKTIQKRLDLSSQGRFITDVFLDRQKKLWLGQAGYDHAMCVDSLLHVSRFPIPIDKEGTINLFREGSRGIYAAANGINSYLFLKSPTSTEFKNISLPVSFTPRGDFNISDMAVSGDTLWLATSEGLLLYDHEKVRRPVMDTAFLKLPVKNVRVYSKGQLLFANPHGLILYDIASGDCALFNESAGLSSNTITTRGMHVDSRQRVWVGTSRGVCYSTIPLLTKETTHSPRIVEVSVNGSPVRFTHDPVFPYGSFATVYVSSFTFPEKETLFQYRFAPTQPWVQLSGDGLLLPTDKDGSVSLEIRSRKNGLYAWSSPSSLRLLVAKPFWKQIWFVLLVLTVLGLLVLASTAWANHQNKKRQVQLELLIDERTRELQIINEELSLRNKELDRFVYSASHDLSAPLKSILGLISVAKLEKPSPSMDTYLAMMERSVTKLDTFIRDIISYSRNARLPIRKDPIRFDQLIRSVWGDHEYNPSASRIRFQLEHHLSGTYYSDEMRWKIVFNNLLSNAIKFSQEKPDTDSYIRVTTRETADELVFTIEDNGIGIPTALQPHIFEMFYRATESAPGSGLGLYILKETLSRMGGHVEVSSELGAGSTFTIRCTRNSFLPD